MHYFNSFKLFFVTCLFVLSLNSFCQLPFNLIDNREHPYCAGCNDLIKAKPIEVLFGIQINSDGDVYFLMNNMEWFNKIFKNNSYGVTVDLVAKSKYDCGKIKEDFSLPRGTILAPTYRHELLNEKTELKAGNMFVKIGKLPNGLMNKELEGNLVVLNGNYICFYTNFVNINRSALQLLPMGLFTDSLIQESKTETNEKPLLVGYTKTVQLQIPFAKASAHFSSIYVRKFFDSVDLANYTIRKVEIRAYSSVEGSYKANKELVSKRADTILETLKKYQLLTGHIKIITAENWLDFFKDIEDTKFSELKEYSKLQIRQKLTDNPFLKEIEPLLSLHRKAIVTLYLEPKSMMALVSNTMILSDFKNAVNDKNIVKAKQIQKEIVERIADNKLPLDYINKLAVPKSKEYASLLNDREVYKYLLKATSEYEALDNFLALKEFIPTNDHINYNICALQFFVWQFGGDTLVPKILLAEINSLPKPGINEVLVKRMLINYHILKCEEYMDKLNYSGKDSSLEIIHSIYDTLQLNDDDIYSLAKYYSLYSRPDWAEEIIEPRIDKLDVSEDLVFYYVNLLFFNPGNYETANFKKATLNAINLNRKRFCHFFSSNDRGGASMQLLDYNAIRKMYCAECQ